MDTDNSQELTKRKTREKYSDIINSSRPGDEDFFRRHPRMPVSERAKIFAPFAALRGYDERLEEEDEKKLHDQDPDDDPSDNFFDS